MKQDTLAPWAESVPDAPFPMTHDMLLALPDDGWSYEVVEGRLVRMPGSRFGDSAIGLLVGAALASYVAPRGLGMVTGADGIYSLPQPGTTDETLLSPDAAFVAVGRYPPAGSREFNAILHLAPDLVVEVASPNQYRPEMAEKARRYLVAGVRLVWVVWPRPREVDVWRPGVATAVQTLGMSDSLDGLDVLPGFAHPVAAIFPGAAPAP
jgi:Uma2 family endonuclease